MAVDFTNYLSAPIESFEAPKAPPVGHWFASIKDYKVAERDFKVRKGVVCTLSFTLTGPDSDVTEPFSEADMKRTRIERDYALDGDNPQQHVLRGIAEQQLGLPVAGLSLGEVLEAMKGHDVKLQLDHRFDNDGNAWPQVKKVLSAHE
jgi:hypothetical protein